MKQLWEGNLSEIPVHWLISRCDSGSNQKGGLTESVNKHLPLFQFNWKGTEMGWGAEHHGLTAKYFTGMKEHFPF